ncbi:MAG: DUF4286 family protein [Phycisphaerae bacterium]
MSRIFYEVTATVSDRGIADEWVRWMCDEHIDKVLAAGADRARLLKLDDLTNVFLVLYEFPNRQAFDHYQATHAPALRAVGAAKFEAEQVRYARRTGEILR